MSHVPKKDNYFPGNNDPYTVTPSTQVTGTYMWQLAMAWLGMHGCTGTDYDRHL